MFNFVLIIFMVFFSFAFQFHLYPEAHAHPVIYQDGVVLSSSNMPKLSDQQIMYSWSHRWASGLNYWRFNQSEDGREAKSEWSLVKLNHLLYRYNGEHSQGNIYLHAGGGRLERDVKKAEGPWIKKSSLGTLAGIEADWETRTLYTAVKYYHFYSSTTKSFPMTQFRLGFAPFESPYDQLQSWFMLQFMHTPKVERSLMITPMLRFFYKNVLWEFGSSTNGDWMLNLMVHY